MELFFPLAHASVLLALGVVFMVYTSAGIWDRIGQNSRFDPFGRFMHTRWPKTVDLMLRSSRFALRTIGLIAIVYGLVVWFYYARAFL